VIFLVLSLAGSIPAASTIENNSIRPPDAAQGSFWLDSATSLDVSAKSAES
jgi:hypothetical protein